MARCGKPPKVLGFNLRRSIAIDQILFFIILSGKSSETNNVLFKSLEKIIS